MSWNTISTLQSFLSCYPERRIWSSEAFVSFTSLDDLKKQTAGKNAGIALEEFAS